MEENKKKSPVMYTNILFKFNNKVEIKKDEIYSEILLSNGEVYTVKIVGSGANGLCGVSQDSFEFELNDFADKKFSQFKMNLDSNEEDMIYEKIDLEEQENKKKYSRKESNNRFEDLKEEYLKDKKNRFKEQYKKDIVEGKILLQANAIFLNEDTKTGLLQIPAGLIKGSGSTTNKRNVHVVSDMILDVTASVYEEEFKRRVITFEELNNMNNQNVTIFTKFNLLNEAIYLKYLFEINGYLLNKMCEKGIYVCDQVYDPNLNNLLFIKSLKSEDSEKTKLDLLLVDLEKWIQKYKQAGKNLDMFNNKVVENQGWLIIPSDEDNQMIKNIYEELENILIVNNKITLSSKEYEIYVNIYFEAQKRMEFLKSIFISLNDNKNSSLVTLGKKDKKDYFLTLPNVLIENIGISLKFVYEKDKDTNGNYILSSFYHYPMTTKAKTVQRVFGYSYSQASGYVPNFKTPSSGIGGGYVLPFSTQNFLKLS